MESHEVFRQFQHVSNILKHKFVSHDSIDSGPHLRTSTAIHVSQVHFHLELPKAQLEELSQATAPWVWPLDHQHSTNEHGPKHQEVVQVVLC